MKRYFAFGCSYSDYDWPMLPDFIGINFEQYYNFGAAGACHSYMLAQLIQANELYKFNPDTDYITIGTTGFGRFTFVTKENNAWAWRKHGDIFPEFDQHPKLARLFAREFDSHTWSVYRSLSSLKTMKLLLTSMGIKHSIYSAIFNKHLINLDFHPQEEETINMINQFNELVETDEAIDELLVDYMSTRGEYSHPWLDGHPTLNVTYDYLKKYFPEFNTDITKSFYEDYEVKMATIPTRAEFYQVFQEDFLRKYRTDYNKLNHIKSHPNYVKE